jgi:hypothetical protein
MWLNYKDDRQCGNITKLEKKKEKKKKKKKKLGATSYYLLGNLLEFFFKTVNLTFFYLIF